MGLVIGRITVGHELRSGIEEALVRVAGHTPAEWRLALTATAGGPWDLALEGPRRRLPPEGGWSVHVMPGGGARYARLLRGRSEQTPGFAAAVVRRLIWEDIDFHHDEVALQEPGIAAAFEDVVWEVVHAYRVPPLGVRLSRWRGEAVPLYVCKVEADPRFAYGDSGWRWWSALVETPEELAASLSTAIAERFPRLAPGPEGRPHARPALEPALESVATL